MKLRYKILIILSSLLLIFLCWDRELRWVGYKKEVFFALRAGPAACGVNTFDYRVSSTEIRRLYRWTTEQAEAKFGVAKDIYGDDQLGYPSVFKTWTLPKGETLMVRLYEGNDSRGLYLRRDSTPLDPIVVPQNCRPATSPDLVSVSGSITWWDCCGHPYYWLKNKLFPGP